MKMGHAQQPSRLCQNLISTVFMAALSVLALPAAHADEYSLTAEVTNFYSWIDPGNANLNGMVNGTALVDSGYEAGSYQGVSYNWSQQVVFAAGTHSIDFGYDSAKLATRRMNNFTVHPAQSYVTPSPSPNSNFDLAKLSFTNGQWFFKARVGVLFNAYDITTGLNNVYTDVVEITSNNTFADPHTGLFSDPLAEADMFVLLLHPEFGSVRVFEAVAQPAGNPGVTGGGILKAHIGSLDPVGYLSAYGAAFLDTSVTSIPNTVPVPEPETYAMLLAGLGLIGVAVKSRKAMQA